METTAYIHGTSPGEHERLGWMNRLLNARELDTLGLRGDERVLECGAGTGLFARALAERLPRGSVLGIELDEHQLAAARTTATGVRNLALRRGDVYEPPLEREEWGSYDLVHARFLLEHLTRPKRAVAAMARAVRPGGRVVLVDDDHDTLRLSPAAPAFERLWRAYCNEYTRRGMDPWIGRRLPTLLSEAGLEPCEATLLFFGACAGMELFPTVMANMVGVVEGAVADVRRSGTLNEADVRAGLEEIRAWSRRAGAALWYGVPYVAARRPG
jgi:ubiquinone/menaquinone biosynthesis C-methylase UbiE